MMPADVEIITAAATIDRNVDWMQGLKRSKQMSCIATEARKQHTRHMNVLAAARVGIMSVLKATSGKNIIETRIPPILCALVSLSC